MIVHVIVLPHGEGPIAKWVYAPNTSNQFVMTVTPSKEGSPPAKVWKELPAKINRLSSKGSYNGVDVFLRLESPEFANLLEVKPLAQLIDDARNHSWGGRIYLVWNRSDLDFHSCCAEGVLENWFLMIANAGVTGLIELADDPKPGSRTSHTLLAAGAQALQSRRKRLKAFVTEGGWLAVLRGGETIEALIDGLIDSDVLPRDSKNEIIVHDRKLIRNDVRNLKRRSRYARRQGSAFAVDLTGMNLDLDTVWGVPTIQFSGVFEWILSFMQLNKASNFSIGPKQYSQTNPRIGWVECRSRSSVQTDAVCEPRLLITSAFGPRRKKDCVEAAQEIGRCMQQLPFNVDVEVHPCISCEMLPDLIESKEFTAWLHIGHGDRRYGLYEAMTGKSASAERWQRCFEGYQGAMQLVLLSACESAEIARRLTAQGVRVAIGFEKRVLVEAAGIVSETVIPAAFQAGDQQAAILHAFEVACLHLERRSYIEKGTKYYIDCSPRAFALQSSS